MECYSCGKEVDKGGDIQYYPGKKMEISPGKVVTYCRECAMELFG